MCTSPVGGPPELPPHARRREKEWKIQVQKKGITSACAEKSAMPGPRQPDAGNYLRMRGEEMLIARIDRRRMELPPHARRREAQDNTTRS